MMHFTERRFYPIIVYTKGATEAELLRGTIAAMRVFEEAGVTPDAASLGEFARRCWDDDGFPDDGITDEEMRAASIWDDADAAARQAISADWSPERKKPIFAVMSLLTDPEVQFADRRKAVELIKERAEDVATGRRRWGEAGLGTLAWIIGEDLGDNGGQFVHPVTIAEFKLAGDRRSKQSKQELMAAIETVIRVTEGRSGSVRSINEEFAGERVTLPVENAPKDGTDIVAIDASGEVAHIRWRTGGDLEEDSDEPYWARLNGDEPFEPVTWAPSTWTREEFTKAYE